jgi:aminoglycoside phosphotransferase (APT) family kinase protein
LERHFGVVEGLRPGLHQGTFHNILEFDAGGRAYVLKANAIGAVHRDLQTACEPWIGQRLQGMSVPGPAVRLVDVTCQRVPFEFAVHEKAQGQSLRDFDHDDALIAPHLQRFAQMLARLHAVALEKYGWLDVQAPWAGDEARGLFDDWESYVRLRLSDHVDVCRRIGAVNDDEASRVHHYFDAVLSAAPKAVGSLLHGDPGNHNVYVDGANIRALLDWEDALVGDPLFDLALLAGFHPPRRHALIFDAYQQVRPFDADWQARFWLYFLRIALARTVHRFRFGVADRADRPKASLRIQQGLDGLTLALG